jgi:hypothetical protein
MTFIVMIEKYSLALQPFMPARPVVTLSDGGELGVSVLPITSAPALRSTCSNIRTLLPPDGKRLGREHDDSPPSTATKKNDRFCGVVSRNEEYNFSFNAMRKDKG